jgi:hypothetical protein
MARVWVSNTRFVEEECRRLVGMPEVAGLTKKVAMAWCMGQKCCGVGRWETEVIGGASGIAEQGAVVGCLVDAHG